MAINIGSSTVKGINVGSTVIARAFLGTQKIYDQLDYPTLDLNFAATKTLDSKITFTRASSGTYFDSNGVMQLASANTPRFDHNPVTQESLGLLIEEQRTNVLRNNTMQGAVIGNPGTLPTNWLVGTENGLSTSIIGLGVEKGIDYVDIRITGTPSSTAYTLFFERTNIQAALNGQTWSAFFWTKIIGGSTTNLTIRNVITFRSAASTAVQSSLSSFSISNDITRVTNTATASNASTAFVHSGIWLTTTVGLAVDITIRIGSPQLELGAFATSVIPTTGTAATRAADVAVMTGTNFSSWYRQDEGTFYVEGSCSNFANSPIFVIPHNGTSNNYLTSPIMTTGGNGRISGVVSGVSWTNITTANSVAVNTTAKVSATYRASDQATCLNGGAVATGTNTSLPAVTTLNIGTWRTGAGNSINGHIRRIAYYPRRLANTELQLLTL